MGFVWLEKEHLAAIIDGLASSISEWDDEVEGQIEVDLERPLINLAQMLPHSEYLALTIF